MKQKSTILNRKRLVLFVCAVLFGIASSAWGADLDYSDYYGNYAGTYSGSGDSNGYWVASVSSTSNVFMTFNSSASEGDGGYLTYSGETGTVGTFSGDLSGSSTTIEANVDSSDGTVDGTWSYSASSYGTITGNAVTSLSFAGSYSGTIYDIYLSEIGTCTMTIGSDGYITGSITSEGETYDFEGGAHPDGYVVVVGNDGDYDFFVLGQESSSIISGVWQSGSGDEGTFSMTANSSSGGDDGDDDDSSCFINSLF